MAIVKNIYRYIQVTKIFTNMYMLQNIYKTKLETDLICCKLDGFCV